MADKDINKEESVSIIKQNELIPLTIDDIRIRTNDILNNLKINRQNNLDLRTRLREEFNNWYEKSMNDLENQMADYCNENSIKLTDKIKQIDDGLKRIHDLELQLASLTKKIGFIYKEAQS